MIDQTQSSNRRWFATKKLQGANAQKRHALKLSPVPTVPAAVVVSPAAVVVAAAARVVATASMPGRQITPVKHALRSRGTVHLVLYCAAF